MASVRVTSDEARTAKDYDQAKIDATTEHDIARFNVEDGFDPEDLLKGLREIVQPASIRARVGMSQDAFAKALRVPLKTLRSWEQGRTSMDPAVASLMTLVASDPERAFQILSGHGSR